MGEQRVTAAEPVFGEFTGHGRKPRHGDAFEVALERIDERGAAVGTIGVHRVRIARAQGGPPVLPGARVAARVVRRRGERIDAAVVETLEDSADAVAPRCAHTADCGGCSFQELAYARQLAEKGALARRLLGGLADELDRAAPGWSVVHGAVQRFHYRNKMDFTFSARRWRVGGEMESDGGHGALGLFARGRHDKVLDLSTCALAPAGTDALLRSARELARQHGLAAWDPLEHHGFLRHLVLRAPRAGGWLVHLVTSAEDAPGFEPFWRGLLARNPSITTLVHGATARLSTVAVADTERVLHGPGHVEEDLLGRRFRISAASFFQTNTDQAERLFALARSWLDEERPRRGGALFDLYCGGGAIGIVLADAFDEVIGLEQVPSAVEDARANAERNAIARARFLCGDVPDLIARRAALALPEPSVVVFDPPRAGIGPKLPPLIGALAAPWVLLVSCNLTAAARDLAALVTEGYHPRRAALVDLFPHTPHLEGLFLLARA